MNDSYERQIRCDLLASDCTIPFDADEVAQRVVAARGRRTRLRRLAASCTLLFVVAVITWRLLPTIESQQLTESGNRKQREVTSQGTLPISSADLPRNSRVDDIEIELAKLSRQQERLQRLSDEIDDSRNSFERLERTRQAQTLTLLRAEFSREIESPDLTELGL